MKCDVKLRVEVLDYTDTHVKYLYYIKLEIPRMYTTKNSTTM